VCSQAARAWWADAMEVLCVAAAKFACWTSNSALASALPVSNRMAAMLCYGCYGWPQLKPASCLLCSFTEAFTACDQQCALCLHALVAGSMLACLGGWSARYAVACHMQHFLCFLLYISYVCFYVRTMFASMAWTMFYLSVLPLCFTMFASMINL
jgi:hypothetical protein